MKKLKLWMVAALTLMVQTTMATDVTPEQAEQKARLFLQSKSNTRRAAVRGELKLTRLTGGTDKDGRQAFYAFNVGQDNGFVLVSGSNLTDDIIGYSDNGSLDMQQLPDNMKAWLQSYTMAIHQLEANGATTARRAAGRVATKTAIAPFMKSQWDQNKPYNSQCPILELNKDQSPTGCTITAMAQVMYYHRWPKGQTKSIPSYTFKFTNSDKKEESFTMPALEPTTFNWDKMYPSYKNSEDGTEVARLMQYLGTAAGTRYGLTETGVTGYESLIAMIKYFDYDQNGRAIWRNQCSYDEWIDMLYAELKAKRPVMYSGSGAGGSHSFVLDGYDEEDFFHVNWGWGGLSDGYFKVALMNPTGQGTGGSANDDDYPLDQVAFFGVQPNTGQAVTPSPAKLAVLSATLYHGKDGSDTWNDKGDESTSKLYNSGYFVYPAVVTNSFNMEDAEFDMGLRLVKDDGSLTRDYTWKGMTKKAYTASAMHSNFEGDFFILDPRADKTLTDGNYKLYFLSKLSTADTWQLVENWDKIYVKLTLDHANEKMTAKLVDNTPHLKVNSISFGTTSPMVGTPTEVTVNLTNNSTAAYSGDLLFADDNEWLNGITSEIAPGETKEVKIFWTPKKAGDMIYYIRCFNWTAIYSDNVTVREKDYTDDVKLDISMKVTNATNFKILGKTAQTIFTVKNPSDNNFRGKLVFFSLHWKEGGEIPITSNYVEKAISVNAKSTATVEMTSKELSGADFYSFSLQYERNGKTEAIDLPNDPYTLAPHFALYDAKGNVSYCAETEPFKPAVTVCAIDLSEATFIPTIDRTTANPNLLVYAGKNDIISGDNVVKGENAENIKLTDDYPFFAPFSFTASHISYTRTVGTSIDLAANKGWTTLMLPFSATGCQATVGSNVTPLKWYTNSTDNADLIVMSFQYENGSEMEFGYPENTLQAYFPYLLGIPATTRDNQSLKGQAITFTADNAIIRYEKASVTGRNYRMTGTVMPITNEKDLYTLNAEGSAFVRGTASVSPFQAYFAPITDKAQYPQLTIRFSSELPTGIALPVTTGKQTTNRYCLDGTPATPSTRGIVIENGRKIVIK
jgi:hypothetical protein